VAAKRLAGRFQEIQKGDVEDDIKRLDVVLHLDDYFAAASVFFAFAKSPA
jgi:hypothetical protein